MHRMPSVAGLFRFFAKDTHSSPSTPILCQRHTFFAKHAHALPRIHNLCQRLHILHQSYSLPNIEPKMPKIHMLCQSDTFFCQRYTFFAKSSTHSLPKIHILCQTRTCIAKKLPLPRAHQMVLNDMVRQKARRMRYGVATMSRRLKMIGLFGRISSLL